MFGPWSAATHEAGSSEDYKHFGAINAAYAKYLQEPYPVRTTIQVAGLPLGAKVQIETVLGR
ncbi:Rid family hydrolase [Arthrobacter pullicola]|uniref:Rid family hydrolase n=1 Tax=Arthrobacter pullicola TaxID=2762224 RepID=UPI00296AEDA7|nr:Rid family hydrolase [Arthrobacter pullicola]